MTLHSVRRGPRGAEPLLLVHGLGSHWQVWQPVLDPLAAVYDVLAVDLPGFGRTPPMRGEPSPAALAGAVREFLAGCGIERAHVVGNSLGGWVALELARAGAARSVTALSPAGLWRDHNPLRSQATLVGARSLAALGRPIAPFALRVGAVRAATMWLAFARPASVPADVAVADATAFATAPGFWPVFEATRERRFEGGQGIAVPVTIAFGDRDRLLRPRDNAARDQLPPHVREVRLPGCGHAPMRDDPDAVVRLVEQTVRSAS